MSKEVQISESDLKNILADDWDFFQEIIIGSGYCGDCGGVVTITDYDVFLNDLFDVILKGRCNKCGNPVNRYAEIGEHEKYIKRARILFDKNN